MRQDERCAIAAKRALFAVLMLAPAAALAQQIPAESYNIYGTSGQIETPSAFGHEDAALAFQLTTRRNMTRSGLSFQITPRLSGVFRYTSLQNYRHRPGAALQAEYFDRSFALHYRLLDEQGWRPALAVGVNDLIGSGVYGGEYLVASKHFGPNISGSVGLGWGRLGSRNGFTNPLGVLSSSFETRPSGTGSSGVGNLEADKLFRGDAAVFAGMAWQASDALRLMAEYSSDAQTREDGTNLTYRSPLNFAAAYRYSPQSTITAQYLYGSDLSLQWTFAINPKKSSFGSGLDPAPLPLTAANPQGQKAAASWSGSEHLAFEQRLGRVLAQEGLVLEALSLSGNRLSVQIRNERYNVSAQALGRAARVLSAQAPASVTLFDLRLSAAGMPVSSTLLPRDKLVELEFHPVAPELLRAATRISDAKEDLPPVSGAYPSFDYAFAPYLRPSFFDPDDPLRADVGLALSARAELMQGLSLSGLLRQRLAGTLSGVERTSDSVLPHVRTDGYLYDKFSGTALDTFKLGYQFRAGPDLYARVSAGYLERGYGGLAGELLWKPQNSRLALGVELAELRQRAFDSHFDFGSYGVTTGHLSAYYDLDNGYVGRVDAGRYLAGDLGATVALDRVFDNGWRIGAYATKTNVSAADFGEGSFDKGIHVTIPFHWMDGKPSAEALDLTVQSLQRDGGARLALRDRLYGQVYGLQARELDATWGRFWK